MNLLIIIGAKYLYLTVVAIAVGYFLFLPREKQKRMALFAAAVLATAYLLAMLLGQLFYNPRPFVSDGITPLIPHAADNGFPSDHVLLTAAIASVLYVFNHKLGIAVFIIAFLVGASRVFAGIHHWTDIFGSLIIAMLAGMIVYKVSKKYPSQHHNVHEI